MENCRWDSWLTQLGAMGGIMHLLGIPLQVKSRLSTSGSWTANPRGVPLKNKHGVKTGGWRSVPWADYDRGLLVHVVVDREVFLYMKGFIDRDEPMPMITALAHSRNRYHLLPFSRGRGNYNSEVPRPGEFAASYQPLVGSNWKTDSDSYVARFDATVPNCWTITVAAT